MISILANIIINKLNNIISWCKRNYRLMAVIIIMVLTAILFYLQQLIDVKNKEIDRISNNCEYYEQLALLRKSNNRVLLLTIDEFRESNDSLIQEILDITRKLKIKLKELKQAQLQQLVVIHDTTVVVKSNDFNMVIRPNDLTSISIIKKDSILKHSLDIRNTQSLFIESKREYKRKYKNWLLRLLHFDFKKRNTYKYQINNSNDLIQIVNTRIIELSK